MPFVWALAQHAPHPTPHLTLPFQNPRPLFVQAPHPRGGDGESECPLAVLPG